MDNLHSRVARLSPDQRQQLAQKLNDVFAPEAASTALGGLVSTTIAELGALFVAEAVAGSGLITAGVLARAGQEVAAAIRPRGLHYPEPRLLCLENTHNRSGGRVIPLDLHRALCRVARERGLAIHMDGARIFNAAIASGAS